MTRWVVFRVETEGRGGAVFLRLAGTSDAKYRDTAIKDVAAAAGEYVAVPSRYLEAAIVHDDVTYSITARSRKAGLQ